ncbi:MAG: hypothetical protein C0501_18850 [Isosphaera sp.]|nr:hypothetical protein [Isosphaera sp.]
MRRVAAIIVAVLPVLTGGPLRCPCQLAALFADHVQSALVVLTPRPTSVEDEPGRYRGERCSCKSHRGPALPGQPTERPPAPGVPCQHCPNVDLVLAVTIGERLAGDRDPGDMTAPPFEAAQTVPLTRRPDAWSLAVPELTSAAPDRLRYCHSFRC